MLVLAAASAANFAAPAAAADNDAPTVGIETVIDRLVALARDRHAVIRLSYRASSCNDFLLPHDPVSVPMRPPRPQSSVLATIHDMFEGTGRVRASEEAGIVRVTIDDPPADILQTRVQLRLRMEERYSAGLAVIALENSGAMTRAERRAGLHQPVIVTSILFAVIPRNPHLPARFRNVTADQVLDQVARTFGAVVMYSFCADNRTFRLEAIERGRR